MSGVRVVAVDLSIVRCVMSLGPATGSSSGSSPNASTGLHFSRTSPSIPGASPWRQADVDEGDRAKALLSRE